jgi:hypothetical protein
MILTDFPAGSTDALLLLGCPDDLIRELERLADAQDRALGDVVVGVLWAGLGRCPPRAEPASGVAPPPVDLLPMPGVEVCEADTEGEM